MSSSRDCDSGAFSATHTCTLTTQDAIVDYNVSIYVTCNSTTYLSNITYDSSAALPMLISSLESPNTTEAIQQGIDFSVIGTGATVYTNQKVYLRSLNGSNVTATVAKVAAYGNQRWIFNYVNSSGTIWNLFNITPVVYVLEMQNMTTKAIRANVTALINATKT